MDQVQLSYLTDEQKQRYKQLESLFEHPGWQVVMAFAANLAEEQLMRAANAQNWDQHRMATGARAAYVQFATLPQTTEHEFAALAEAAQEEASAEYE